MLELKNDANMTTCHYNFVPAIGARAKILALDGVWLTHDIFIENLGEVGYYASSHY